MRGEKIPVFTTQEERYMLWSRANDTPFIAIRNAERGFLFLYDMKPADASLDTDTVQQIRNIAKPYRMEIGPASQTELVGGEVGPYSGTVCCSNEDEAQKLGEELRGLIEERSNWV